MNQPKTNMELSLSALSDTFEIPRSTLQQWRDHVWKDVGDPPYTLNEFKIILEGGIEKAQQAIGASKNKNLQKIAKILSQLP
jgi:hypothetical protein